VVNLSYDEQKKIKSLQNRLSKVENEIRQIEASIKNDDIELSNNENLADTAFFDSYNLKQMQLLGLMEEWESIQLQLEAIN
jgi:ATP-binding cassette subfamily F protein 3